MSEPVIYSAMIEAGGGQTVNGDPSLLFPWWSYTKTVLAAGALQLVGQGRLRLDDVLPGRPYTLRELLQHRAGVPNYGRLTSYVEAVERRETPWMPDELLERVRADRLDFAPGEGWTYSNVGCFLVRRLIEETVGDEIGAALQRLVLGPLDLGSVSLVTEPADLDGTAWGNRHGYHPGWVYHGLLIGTAMDAACFLDGLMAGRLLPSGLLETMKKLHRLGGPLSGRPWEMPGYGLGLMVGRMAEAGFAIGHSGGGPRSVSAVYHFPERGSPCTIAAFAEGTDEGITEHAVARLAAQ